MTCVNCRALQAAALSLRHVASATTSASAVGSHPSSGADVTAASAPATIAPELLEDTAAVAAGDAGSAAKAAAWHAAAVAEESMDASRFINIGRREPGAGSGSTSPTGARAALPSLAQRKIAAGAAKGTSALTSFFTKSASS
ncbi:MAG: hypothetical protein EOO41_05840 [Methanobacteriota archaeon]|nr:MAG: hypothetical protein EOO41_05840 [Euryarchaeota archaeon]